MERMVHPECCRPLDDQGGCEKVPHRNGRPEQRRILSQEGRGNERGQGIGQRQAEQTNEGLRLEARMGISQEASGHQEPGCALGTKSTASSSCETTGATYQLGGSGAAPQVEAVSCGRSGPNGIHQKGDSGFLTAGASQVALLVSRRRFDS